MLYCKDKRLWLKIVRQPNKRNSKDVEYYKKRSNKKEYKCKRKNSLSNRLDSYKKR